MIAPSKGRTSMLLTCRMIGNPRRFQGRASRDSVSCSLRSFADGASCPLRRTKRTSKPFRLRRFHNDRKGRRISFFHKASFPLRDANPCKFRRGRRPRRVFVHRKSCRARLRYARACVFSPSRAPCAGGSRDSARRMRIPRVFPWRIGRARICVLSRGSLRKDFVRAQAVCARI